MKLALTAAAVAITLGAAAPAFAEDAKVRTYDIEWGGKFDFEQRGGWPSGGRVDKQAHFRVRGRITGFKMDDDGYVIDEGQEAADPVFSELIGFRKQWGMKGEVVEDCDMTDGWGVGARIRASAKRRLFFSPMNAFQGTTPQCGHLGINLEKQYPTGKALIRMPVDRPEIGAKRTVENVQAIVSGDDCPAERRGMESIPCSAKFRGQVVFEEVSVEDDLLAPLTPPKKGPVKVTAPPKVNKRKSTLEYRVLTTESGTMRVLVFPEPPSRGGKPRATIAQDDQPIAQFVEIVTAGEPKLIAVPLDANDLRAVEAAGGVRIQTDLFAGPKPIRVTFSVAV